MKSFYPLSLFFILFISCNSFAQEPARIIVESIEGVTPWNSLEINNKTENLQPLCFKGRPLKQRGLGKIVFILV